MKRGVYALIGLGVLGVAGWMIFTALTGSLVYFVLPSEYAQNTSEYAQKRLRLGGIVEAGTVLYDPERLRLTFKVSDSIQSYPVSHYGAPPELFKENTGVVIEGRFEGNTFHSDNLLVKHSEVYQAPADGSPIDVDVLKETLQ